MLPRLAHPTDRPSRTPRRGPGRGPRLALAVLVPLVLVLGACSGGDDGGEDGNVEVATGTASTETPTVEASPEPTIAWPEVATGEVITEDLNVRMGPATSFPVLGRLQPGDQISVAGRGTDGRWLAVPGVGWVAYDDTWVTLSAPLEDLPLISPEDAGFEFVSPLHPVDASSDIPVVDQVVAALVEGDRETLLSLAQPATGESEEGPSEEGAATATEEAGGRVPNGACTQDTRPASELEASLDDFLASATGAEGPLRLYAVVGTPETDDAGATFSPILAFEGGEARQLWLSSTGQIEWFTLGCGGPTTPGTLLERADGDHFFWLRPVTPEPLDAAG